MYGVSEKVQRGVVMDMNDFLDYSRIYWVAGSLENRIMRIRLSADLTLLGRSESLCYSVDIHQPDLRAGKHRENWGVRRTGPCHAAYVGVSQHGSNIRTLLYSARCHSILCAGHYTCHRL